MPVPVDSILSEFDSRATVLAGFAERIEELLIQILEKWPLPVHSVRGRFKDRNTLHEKLLRETAEYQRLSDVTDVVGVRVITFFPDDVDTVADIVKSQFTIDDANSIDKRAVLDPDRFGYLSLHYVASLDHGRSNLDEWRDLDDIPFEIQIRTLLQHTWAEIEHDLGYKTERAIPRAVRRRFSRLAGMLELADAEFVGIRDDLREYKAEVEVRIEITPESLPIDQASLLTFVEKEALVGELDLTIAQRLSARLETSPNYLGRRSVELERLGLRSLLDVEQALVSHAHRIPQFAERWMRSERYEVLRRGISLYFLMLILFTERGSPAELAPALDLDERHRLRAMDVYRALA